ncbi:MAG TPA: LPS assembly lipoprotein LptE [Gammaproteobacteria bacterium]|nr:LPS assembly lipoprotein LptE [Gammaproteobacteria bacterium]
MRKLLAIGSLGLLVSACGFHLRQAPDLPPSMRKIYVAAPGQSGQLLRELRRSLASDQTEVLDTPDGATSTLSIIEVQHSSHPLAVDRNGNALEYQVTYTVEFSLIVQGATVLEPQSVTLNHNYAYNITNAVGNEEQEQALNQAMAKDISQFIAFRIAAAAKNLPPYVVTSAAPMAATASAAKPAPVPAAATAKPPV